MMEDGRWEMGVGRWELLKSQVKNVG